LKEKRKDYCAVHKEYGMIDFIHKKCIYENCKSLQLIITKKKQKDYIVVNIKKKE
jgi:hypothetical protein